MFVTDRNKPKSLLYYDVLSKYRQLSGMEARHHKFMIQGYEGECQYDALFDGIGHDNLLIYRDVWLKIANAVTQIDSLILTGNQMIVNEIKNYSGMYKLENGNWYVQNTQISEDPVAQVNRSAGKLIRLRNQSSLHFEVDKRILFTHADFNLKMDIQNSSNLIVMRSMLKPYMKQVSSLQHEKPTPYLSELIDAHIIEDPFQPESTDKTRLNTGVFCYRCQSRHFNKSRYVYTCTSCGYKEPCERMAVRTILSFSILFPQEPITFSGITWLSSNLIGSSVIQKALYKYCTLSHSGRFASYSVPEQDLPTLLSRSHYSSRYENDPLFILQP